MTSSFRTPRHWIRSAIEPSSIEARNCGSRELPLQPDGNFGLGRRGQNVPGLGLAVHQADRMRERIVRMNLNGQRLFGEQQLEQQGRIGRSRVGTLEPEFADCDTVRLDIAPGQQVGAPPRFAHNLRTGMFDRHDVLLYGLDRAA